MYMNASATPKAAKASAMKNALRVSCGMSLTVQAHHGDGDVGQVVGNLRPRRFVRNQRSDSDEARDHHVLHEGGATSAAACGKACDQARSLVAEPELVIVRSHWILL